MSIHLDISQYVVFKVQTIIQSSEHFVPNGDEEIRTLDPLLARQVLSQLSYTPMVTTNYEAVVISDRFILGLSGLEPPTSRLSGGRSNRLSYKPMIPAATYFSMPSPA